MVPKGTNFRNFLVTYTLVCKISSTVLHDSCRRDSYTSRNKSTSTPYLQYLFLSEGDVHLPFAKFALRLDALKDELTW